MKISCKLEFKSDFSGLNKLRKELESNHLKVGYIDSDVHWKHEGTDSDISVAEVARQLHYSGWDEFMLSEVNKNQIQEHVDYNLKNYFGVVDTRQLLENIGTDLEEQIRDNIENTTSPTISEQWAREKGFNKPLQHGSLIGISPNLMSEVTHSVDKGK